ncbi:FAD-dependent oxidoreductase [Rhizobium sp. CNPSo 3464]|uniref:NAD(P)/FAD-dependent oxidoreductase n=1 Tax=Rhizobium sp. CNPSo 3464 TaxID=3021406 RepID=UPI002550A50F|nr:FAD-dependent oxidoreductase [Rhizobium sp. CNPSo 3464]MDK4740470.1 FAD-dependent oxidoreductase [Rhizobium sp. CNPSo 3464]
MSDVTIIGGGIIGVCTAIALQNEGFSVELVDRGIATEGASYGNCGLLAVGEVVPISKPGVITKIPKWLLDPESPLFVRPKDMITQMPWLLRFLWSGRRKRVLEIAKAMAPLTHRAEDDYKALFAQVGISDNLVPAENITAFNSKADYEADQFSWDLRRQHGFNHRFLTGEELRSLEPALDGPISCGVLLEGWLQFSDPGLVQQRLTKFYVSRGGKLRTASVERIETDGKKAVAVHLAGGERLQVRCLAICAGAWSGKLVRHLGIKVPIAALQGYHHHLPKPGVTLNRAVLYANGGFVLTPMESGLRIGGTIEVAGVDPRPNFERANIIARKAVGILPGLDISGGQQWMGPRPFMPDTLPVIDRAPNHDNVILAFGHGQVGMTLGATTGRIVSDLIAGRTPGLDLSPYRSTRF